MESGRKQPTWMDKNPKTTIAWVWMCKENQ